MDIDPSEVLKEARYALKQKEYATALEKYQWFYDNSLKIKESFYGVRLSYCLADWAQLGKAYPPAMDALLIEKNKSLDSFKKTYSRVSFHEYSSIAEYLDHQEEVFNQFLFLCESKKEITHNLFRFVYDYCANNHMWSICREYMGSGKEQYEESIETFDHIISVSKRQEGEASISLHQEAVECLQRDILRILNMLFSVKALDEYNSTLSRIEADLKERGFDNLFDELLSKTPNPSLKRDDYRPLT